MTDELAAWRAVRLKPKIARPGFLGLVSADATTATISVFLWKLATPLGFRRSELLRSALSVLLRALSNHSTAVFYVEMRLDYIEVGIRCAGSDVEKELEILFRLIEHLASSDVLIKLAAQVRADLADQYRNDCHGGLSQLRQLIFSEHPYAVWAAHSFAFASTSDDSAVARELEFGLAELDLSFVAIVPPNGVKGLHKTQVRFDHLIGRNLKNLRLESEEVPAPLVQPLDIGSLGNTELAAGSRTFGLANSRSAVHAILAAALLCRSGRLYTILRDEHALVYPVSALVEQGIHGGVVGAYVRSRANVLDRVLNLTTQEIRRLWIDGLRDEELHKCKQIVGLSLAESLSSPSALIQRIGLCRRQERAWDVELELREVEGVTVSAVRAALSALAQEPIVTLTGQSSNALRRPDVRSMNEFGQAI